MDTQGVKKDSRRKYLKSFKLSAFLIIECISNNLDCLEGDLIWEHDNVVNYESNRDMNRKDKESNAEDAVDSNLTIFRDYFISIFY